MEVVKRGRGRPKTLTENNKPVKCKNQKCNKNAPKNQIYCSAECSPFGKWGQNGKWITREITDDDKET